MNKLKISHMNSKHGYKSVSFLAGKSCPSALECLASVEIVGNKRKIKDGKFAKLPTPKLLERLNKRNEYYCSSRHPLKEIIINQTGENSEKRKLFLQNSFNEAKKILIHTWETPPKGISTF